MLSTALVCTLGWQNKQLREERDLLGQRATEAYYGMYVPELHLTDLNGRPQELADGSHAMQVLYFFSPDCNYCKANAPYINNLATRLQAPAGNQVPLLGVGTHDPASVRRHVSQYRLNFPVVATEDRRTLMQFRANNVPLLLVVGRDGRVRHVHYGALQSNEQVGTILAAIQRESLIAANPPNRSQTS